eukprot:TRINITY_DN6285_c0_g2_i4.p1 TRINITY_DN6285_c0_g2~~TRINITY_DN6285_c0_g2_i4.p1  ORF type:complete len:109 (+),score=30.75 TRINITY_DN6285_c0_g2_i4:106-432(+)
MGTVEELRQLEPSSKNLLLYLLFAHENLHSHFEIDEQIKASKEIFGIIEALKQSHPERVFFYNFLEQYNQTRLSLLEGIKEKRPPTKELEALCSKSEFRNLAYLLEIQ